MGLVCYVNFECPASNLQLQCSRAGLGGLRSNVQNVCYQVGDVWKAVRPCILLFSPLHPLPPPLNCSDLCRLCSHNELLKVKAVCLAV